MQPYYMHGVVLLCITHPRHPRLCMQSQFFWFQFQSSPHHDSAYHQPPSLYLSKTFPISSYRSRKYSDYHIISHSFSSSHILSVSVKYLRLVRGSSHPRSSKLQSAYYYLGVPLSPYLLSYYVHPIIIVFKFFGLLHMKE
jgi:hypothetical protein